VLELKLLSALYTAVIECEATVSEAGVNVATPELSALVANELVPSLNVTVPVGVPVPGEVAVTVAVRVTDWPDTEGLTDDARTVPLLALVTVCVTTPEVLVLKLLSPPYTAVMLCADTESADVAKVVEPPLKVPVPIVLTPSLNVTVPEGVPDPGATGLTVAVKVTVWPDTEGLADELSAVVLLSTVTVWVNGEPVLSLPLKLVSPP
jgi:hypothetical protein